MKILFIAPSFPYPLTHGGKIRMFNIIKYLSRNHKVTLACLSEDTIADYGPLSQYCEEIKVVTRKPQWLRERMRFVLRSEPYNAIRYSSGSFRNLLMELLKSRRFDVVQIEFPMMWQYARLVKDIPIVLDMHNIEYDLIRQMKEASSNVLKKLLYGLEEKRLKQIEEDAWKECSLCVAVSDRERDMISAHIRKDGRVITISNGVDLERFAYVPKKTSERRILFIGSMDYIPTIDSTDYLLEEIFPIILSKIEGVKLDIVGRSLWRIRDKLSAGEVSLHENVPDIIPFLKKADVLIDPLRIGAGTRLKILEAMAAGTPVVTTSKGCEGIKVKNGEHLLIADSSLDFADATVKLLTDRELSDSLTGNARQLVEEKYSWEKVVLTLERAIRALG